MFDIRIGTLIPVMQAKKAIPMLNEKGFESYELDFAGVDMDSIDFAALAEDILSVLDGRVISAVGYYRNPIRSEADRNGLAKLIRNLSALDCHVIGAFAGSNPDKTIPDTIPEFRAVWEPLAALAEDYGVRIGFEGCGGGWWGGSHNIAYCPDAWDLMFDAVPSTALGLEWEPCHAIEGLADPIMQLRHYAKRVVHVHGKDGTVAWDVIREHGIRTNHSYC